MSEVYEATVWNLVDGDIERKLWQATWEEVEDLIDYYADDPLFEVQWVEK